MLITVSSQHVWPVSAVFAGWRVHADTERTTILIVVTDARNVTVLMVVFEIQIVPRSRPARPEQRQNSP
jgi:hypothetical protein